MRGKGEAEGQAGPPGGALGKEGELVGGEGQGGPGGQGQRGAGGHRQGPPYEVQGDYPERHRHCRAHHVPAVKRAPHPIVAHPELPDSTGDSSAAPILARLSGVTLCSIDRQLHTGSGWRVRWGGEAALHGLVRKPWWSASGGEERARRPPLQPFSSHAMQC